MGELSVEGEMVRKKRVKSEVVRISPGIMEGIETFMKTKEAHDLGLDLKKIAVVDYAMRMLLKKYGIIEEPKG